MLTKTTHTPGPWKVDLKNTHRNRPTVLVGAEKVERWGCESATTQREKSVANARLMAAAPDMLDMLQTVALSYTLPTFDANRIKSVVEKATGVRFACSTDEAKSHLFAAAPDLLAALERLEKVTAGGIVHDEAETQDDDLKMCRDEARAAIAKAKGGE